jgi:hypothetical protein
MVDAKGAKVHYDASEDTLRMDENERGCKANVKRRNIVPEGDDYKCREFREVCASNVPPLPDTTPIAKETHAVACGRYSTNHQLAIKHVQSKECPASLQQYTCQRNHRTWSQPVAPNSLATD